MKERMNLLSQSGILLAVKTYQYLNKHVRC
jgi:hypothetical protein